MLRNEIIEKVNENMRFEKSNIDLKQENNRMKSRI